MDQRPSFYERHPEVVGWVIAGCVVLVIIGICAAYS